MESQKPTLMQFIESYAQHSAKRNFPALVAQFADSFLVAGPAGAQCVRAEDFAKALPRRAEWFESLGAQPADLVSVDATWIDPRYVLVNTTWRFTFLRDQGRTECIDSVSVFLVDAGAEPYRILLYLNPGDIVETMRERGIVP